jgi:hypothetical protein
VPHSETGAELLFEMLSQRYERGSTMLTCNLPFAEWTEVLGSKRLTGALLDRLTHHVHILEMNGDSVPTRAVVAEALRVVLVSVSAGSALTMRQIAGSNFRDLFRHWTVAVLEKMRSLTASAYPKAKPRRRL